MKSEGEFPNLEEQEPGTGASPGAQQSRIGLQCKRGGLNPWIGAIPWRRIWQPTDRLWQIVSVL